MVDTLIPYKQHLLRPKRDLISFSKQTLLLHSSNVGGGSSIWFQWKIHILQYTAKRQKWIKLLKTFNYFFLYIKTVIFCPTKHFYTYCNSFILKVGNIFIYTKENKDVKLKSDCDRKAVEDSPIRNVNWWMVMGDSSYSSVLVRSVRHSSKHDLEKNLLQVGTYKVKYTKILNISLFWFIV